MHRDTLENCTSGTGLAGNILSQAALLISSARHPSELTSLEIGSLQLLVELQS